VCFLYCASCDFQRLKGPLASGSNVQENMGVEDTQVLPTQAEENFAKTCYFSFVLRNQHVVGFG
jgi:hypothetical protein